MTGAWRRWPLLALALIAGALAVDVWNHPEEIGIDYHTYAAAAVVGLQHGWSHIYDQDLVAIAQKALVPSQRTQPYLSPPPVAWLAALLVALPYEASFYAWAAAVLVAFVAALAWSASGRGLDRWIPVGGALAPWWVLHAVRLGQVVPFVSAGVVVAWRLVREEQQVAAGLALTLVLLKPNTAILVPFALLAAGRYRTFLSWAAASAAVVVVVALMIGTHGVSAYVTQLTGPLPHHADALSLERAFGLSGAPVQVLRVVIVAATLAAAFRLRKSPGLVMAVGILGSLLMTPYLHGSDLCLLSAAAFMVWEERPAPAWRLSLAAGWVVATPFAVMSGVAPYLSAWPLLEMGLLAALVVMAWRAAGLRSRDRVVGA